MFAPASPPARVGAARRRRDERRVGIAPQPLEVGAQLGGRLVAHLAVLFEGLLDDLLELRRQLRIDAGRRRRLPVQDGAQDDGRIPAEGPASRGHLVEHEAEREEVRPGVERFAGGLLRRHVEDCPDRDPGRCDQPGLGRRVCLRFAQALHFRQPEVEHLRAPVAGDEDVRRLDIAMDDALGVRGLERIRDLNSQIEHFWEPEGMAIRQPLPQRLAFEQLHGQQRLTVGVVDLVDRADVRVVQRRGGARLALEALECEMVARELRRQELQRNVTAAVWCRGRDTPHPCHPSRSARGRDSER